MVAQQAVQTLDIRQSRQVAELQQVGRQIGRRFTVLGTAPAPTRPVRMGDYLAAPAELDSSPLPQPAWDCVQAVAVHYPRPLRFVVVHEAPPGLPAPAEATLLVIPGRRSPRLAAWVKTWMWVAAGLAAVILLVAGLVFLAVAMAALVGTLMMPLAIVGAVGLDPILVAVTEDGVWVELYRWK